MNTAKSDVVQLLKDIKLKEGETKRVNCPFCGGRNTFTITRREGVRIWNCYKASCTASGATGDIFPVEAIKMRITGKDSRLNAEKCVLKSNLPAVSVPVDNHEYAVRYLKSVHAYQAYVEGLVHVSYAPKEHRVLFWLNNDTGAIGRSLKGAIPKWKVYGDCSGLFTCGSGPTAVVVEDAASACAVGVLPGYTGVALMGTHIDSVKKRELTRFPRLVICLDNDASRKALTLVRKMEGFVPTSVRFLKQDFKWLEPQEIASILA